MTKESSRPIPATAAVIAVAAVLVVGRVTPAVYFGKATLGEASRRRPSLSNRYTYSSALCIGIPDHLACSRHDVGAKAAVLAPAVDISRMYMSCSSAVLVALCESLNVSVAPRTAFQYAVMCCRSACRPCA